MVIKSPLGSDRCNPPQEIIIPSGREIEPDPSLDKITEMGKLAFGEARRRHRSSAPFGQCLIKGSLFSNRQECIEIMDQDQTLGQFDNTLNIGKIREDLAGIDRFAGGFNHSLHGIDCESDPAFLCAGKNELVGDPVFPFAAPKPPADVKDRDKGSMNIDNSKNNIRSFREPCDLHHREHPLDIREHDPVPLPVKDEDEDAVLCVQCNSPRFRQDA